MVKCPDGEWVGYILYYKKKKGVGGVINGAYARINSTDDRAEYESFAFGFDTAEILNTNHSHLHLALDRMG